MFSLPIMFLLLFTSRAGSPCLPLPHAGIGTRSWQRLIPEAAPPQRWASGALGQHNYSPCPGLQWQLLGKDPAVTRGSADTPHPAGMRNGEVEVAASRMGARAPRPQRHGTGMPRAPGTLGLEAARPITSLDLVLLQPSLPLGCPCQAVSADGNAK